MHADRRMAKQARQFRIGSDARRIHQSQGAPTVSYR
jgi:hypothetical protein